MQSPLSNLHRFLALLELVVGGDVRLIQKLDLIFMVIDFVVDAAGDLSDFILKKQNFLLKLFLLHCFRQFFLLLCLQDKFDDFWVWLSFGFHIGLQAGDHHWQTFDQLSARVDTVIQLSHFHLLLMDYQLHLPDFGLVPIWIKISLRQFCL